MRNHQVLIFLGSATWVYLALIHIWFIALSGDHFLAEMVVSYMPILAMPTVSGVKEMTLEEGRSRPASDWKVMNLFQNLGDIVLPLAYKQVGLGCLGNFRHVGCLMGNFLGLNTTECVTLGVWMSIGLSGTGFGLRIKSNPLIQNPQECDLK